jgi:polyribonucleotide nucleotidyltransferase
MLFHPARCKEQPTTNNHVMTTDNNSTHLFAKKSSTNLLTHSYCVNQSSSAPIVLTNFAECSLFDLVVPHVKRSAESFRMFPRSRRQEWFNGVVARIVPFGAFVTVTLEDGPSADGLLHVSKIKDGNRNGGDRNVAQKGYER